MTIATNGSTASSISSIGLSPTEWPVARSNRSRRAWCEGAQSERAHRIGLVGLRGAGKSTLGRMLAERLGYPFVELNRVVEQEYGASISMLIEMSGVSSFRRYERASLEKVIADHDKVVIATAGGIVSSPETYALLLRRTHTVWVKAQPQEHMNRVMAQGDFRPMSENREAMADLVAILEARSQDYAQAEARARHRRAGPSSRAPTTCSNASRSGRNDGQKLEIGLADQGMLDLGTENAGISHDRAASRMRRRPS